MVKKFNIKPLIGTISCGFCFPCDSLSCDTSLLPKLKLELQWHLQMNEEELFSSSSSSSLAAVATLSSWPFFEWGSYISPLLTKDKFLFRLKKIIIINLRHLKKLNRFFYFLKCVFTSFVWLITLLNYANPMFFRKVFFSLIFMDNRHIIYFF